LIDPLQLNDRLTPFAGSGSPCGTSTPSTGQFDEASWETFTNQYNEEVVALRMHEIVRFRHIGRGIDGLWDDLKDDTTSPVFTSAKHEFVVWWAKMHEVAKEYEKEVQMLQVPELEQIKLDRIAVGLPL